VQDPKATQVLRPEVLCRQTRELVPGEVEGDERSVLAERPRRDLENIVEREVEGLKLGEEGNWVKDVIREPVVGDEQLAELESEREGSLPDGRLSS
jgi:hypothetical protein